MLDIETNGVVEPGAGGSLRRARAGRAAVGVRAISRAPTQPAAERDVAAGRSDPAAPGRRPRAHRALGQLPQGREHLLHRRPDPAHRNRAAEDAEPRPQVAERDQGSARVARPVARHEARELAAGGPRSASNLEQLPKIERRRSATTRKRHAPPTRTAETEPHQQPSPRDAAQHDQLAVHARGDQDHAAEGEGAAPRRRADDHAGQEADARQSPAGVRPAARPRRRRPSCSTSSARATRHVPAAICAS